MRANLCAVAVIAVSRIDHLRVLPLFEHGNNGCVAAAMINEIVRAAPHVACVNISGGPVPGEDGHQIVDLMRLQSGPMPEVVIRIKETLGIRNVTVRAPPHVAIRLERDGSAVNVFDALAPKGIESMVLERSAEGGPVVTQHLQFGVTALPLPPFTASVPHNFAALADGQPLMEETAVAVRVHEPSTEGKRD